MNAVVWFYVLVLIYSVFCSSAEECIVMHLTIALSQCN